MKKFNSHFHPLSSFSWRYLALTLILSTSLFICACGSKQFVAEDPFTLSNWKQALELRNQERYELAYHYYSIALSSATSEAAIVQLKKEMEDMQRVIRSAR